MDAWVMDKMSGPVQESTLMEPSRDVAARISALHKTSPVTIKGFSPQRAVGMVHRVQAKCTQLPGMSQPSCNGFLELYKPEPKPISSKAHPLSSKKQFQAHMAVKALAWQNSSSDSQELSDLSRYISNRKSSLPKRLGTANQASAPNDDEIILFDISPVKDFTSPVNDTARGSASSSSQCFKVNTMNVHVPVDGLSSQTIAHHQHALAHTLCEAVSSTGVQTCNGSQHVNSKLSVRFSNDLQLNQSTCLSQTGQELPGQQQQHGYGNSARCADKVQQGVCTQQQGCRNIDIVTFGISANSQRSLAPSIGYSSCVSPFAKTHARASLIAVQPEAPPLVSKNSQTGALTQALKRASCASVNASSTLRSARSTSRSRTQSLCSLMHTQISAVLNTSDSNVMDGYACHQGVEMRDSQESCNTCNMRSERQTSWIEVAAEQHGYTQIPAWAVGMDAQGYIHAPETYLVPSDTQEAADRRPSGCCQLKEDACSGNAAQCTGKLGSSRQSEGKLGHVERVRDWLDKHQPADTGAGQSDAKQPTSSVYGDAGSTDTALQQPRPQTAADAHAHVASFQQHVQPQHSKEAKVTNARSTATHHTATSRPNVCARLFGMLDALISAVVGDDISGTSQSSTRRSVQAQNPGTRSTRGIPSRNRPCMPVVMMPPDDYRTVYPASTRSHTNTLSVHPQQQQHSRPMVVSTAGRSSARGNADMAATAGALRMGSKSSDVRTAWWGPLSFRD